MAVNLVSVVMQYLTPDLIAKIASSLGIDREIAQKAIGGAVPALLSNLAEVASTPGGARQLSNTLSQQQPEALESLKSAMAGSGQKEVAESGSAMLAGMFGGRALDTTAQAIAKFAGIGEGTGKLLTGMLGPLVLGALGQHQRSAGLDAGGLTSLLSSQKDQIAAELPSGLADQLSAAGIIDRAEDSVRSGASAAASRIGGASARYTPSSAMSQWPYWLGGLVVLGGLLWYALERPGEQTVAEQPAATRPATGTVGVAPANLTVDGVNLGSQIDSSVSTLKASLSGITDAASAQAALPRINEAVAQLNDVSARAAKLPPEGRSALAKLIVVVTPSIYQMCDKVMATPGVGPLAKPAIDDLRARLDSLAKA
ncbi:DUF937 domain-containing protein [Bradyrhizobium sp. Ai1a-2]|uniref:DUF937 domain-containing protein n=1 Tax=Bradyrhizobium sp. Ai1a-2 TaxID=196490 RepID=UPI00040F99BE|nr:DUF937 domain-containing protein [Bradyrhizobium sp. Ai1a-2]